MRKPLLALLVVSISSPALAQPAPVAPLDPYPPEERTAEPSARIELIADGTAIGLVGGIALVDWRDVANEESATLVVVGSAAAGAGAGYLLAEGTRATQAESNTVSWGLIAGAAGGGLLARPLDADRSEEVLGLLFATSAVGAGTGLIATRLHEPRSADVVESATITSLGIGSAAFLMMAGRGESFGDRDRDLVLVAAGLEAGAVAGWALSPSLDWSQRRARLVAVSTAVGLGVGAGGAVVVNGDDPSARATGLGCLLGMWGGFAVGVLATSDVTDSGDGPRRISDALILPLIGDGQAGVAAAGRF